MSPPRSIGLVLLACAATVVSCGDDTGGQPAPPSPQSFTVVVLPDTQYYAAVFHDIFPAQTQWIVGHRDEQQIAFVIHEGDIVDADYADQWGVASSALRALDGVVPYVLTAGNHDYAGPNLADRMGMINAYFAPSTFTASPWFGGTYEEGHIENNYSIVMAGGRSWLLMSLEFGPRDEVVAWASQVLKNHADKEAIIVTHAYLYGNDRYDFAAHPEQLWNPHRYFMADHPGSTINDGEELFRKLIEPNRNVRFVLSGHVITPGAGRLTSTRADGTRVHQILANYQSCDYACEFADGKKVNGGNGYLRLMRFDPTAHQVSVSTYSPYLDRYLRDADNEFVLPWDD